MEFGKYETLGLVAKGSFGDVYKVRNNNSVYAMKKLKISGMKNYERRNVISELKILSGHKCPFLIEYKCVFCEHDSVCIVMQYCTRGTLENEIKKGLNDDTIWKYLAQITFGLDYLHKNQIIYRDLKSSNILLDNNDNIRLIDFGIAKIMNNYIKYTKTCIGTPYYMSPEAISNIHYNYKTDIWALGVLLYEMTQKTLPFLAKNVSELYYKISYTNFEFNLKTHEVFKTIIKKCLQRSTYKRISLHTLLEMPQIKQHLIDKIEHINIKFSEIQIPMRTRDWPRLVQKLPCKLSTEKVPKKLKFFDHYTKSQLIDLNTKLLEQIVQKNEHILYLEKQLKLLKGNV